MSTDKQKSIEAMRTFARDLERERAASGVIDDEKVSGKKAVKDGGKDRVVPETKTEAEETPKLKAQKGPDIKVSPEKESGVKSEKKKGFFSAKKKLKKKKETKSPEPKSIPAFHELQKVVETNIKAEEKKETPKVKPAKGIQPTKAVGGGTVITDTKKEKHPLFPQIAKSFKRWLASIKKSPFEVCLFRVFYEN